MPRGPVAVVFHRFAPYHLARLEAAGSRLPVIGIEVVAKDKTYAWDVVQGANGFRRVTLFGKEAECRRAGALGRRLWEVLERERPAVVALPGWAFVEALAGLVWTVRRGVPAVLMSDSQVHDRRRHPVTEWIKRRVVGLYAAALVGGSTHAGYAANLGMPRERIFTGYDVVDNGHFARGAALARGQAGLRGRLGLPERYFLSVCRFERVKNIPALLEAYWRYRQKAADPSPLVLVGDGSLGSRVRAEVGRWDLECAVFLPGFRQYGELPAYYGLAGCFVLASTSEPWGLVVNEAMASGLPVLVSRRCGCAPDLVEEGGNGFTFDPCDVEQLAELMRRVSAMPEEQRQAMGRRSQEIISRWGPERFARSLAKAVEAALSAPQRKAAAMDRMLLSALIALEGCAEWGRRCLTSAKDLGGCPSCPIG